MSHLKALKLASFLCPLAVCAIGPAFAECGTQPGFYSCANEWSAGGVTNLSGLSGSQVNYAYGINNAGQVVGYTVLDNVSYAVEWSGGSVSALPRFSDGGSDAHGINNHGQVVGESIVPTGVAAIEWSGGTATDLGGLPGSRFNEASAINDVGQIIGVSTGGGTQLAEEWSDGAVTELAPLPGFADSEPTATIAKAL
jgi:probable HAF family extracellular repeat protein